MDKSLGRRRGRTQLFLGGRCQEGRRRRICRSDRHNPGDILTAEQLQGVEVNIRCSLGKEKALVFLLALQGLQQ